MEGRAIAYQAEMQNAYRGKIRNLYNYAAASVFKEQYSPADPFEGILIPAEFLAISELVAVFKGAKALEDEGNSDFISELIERRQDSETPLIRVNRHWLNTCRRHKKKICEYLQKACFEFDKEVRDYEQEIRDVDDPQLNEYLRQAQECLAIETEVSADEV